ncbi:hypothetical protein ES703_120635 [subsurface metagenome]
MTDHRTLIGGMLVGMGIMLIVRIVIDAIIDQWRKKNKEKKHDRP